MHVTAVSILQSHDQV